jgi:hypothetical protein
LLGQELHSFGKEVHRTTSERYMRCEYATTRCVNNFDDMGRSAGNGTSKAAAIRLLEGSIIYLSVSEQLLY